MGSIVGVVALGIFVAYSFFQVREMRRIKRVKRLYEEADIRMVGGPLDGVLLDYATGGFKWPPQSPTVHYLWVEEERHYVPHVYERTEEGEYHFSRTLPPVQHDPADVEGRVGEGGGGF